MQHSNQCRADAETQKAAPPIVNLCMVRSVLVPMVQCGVPLCRSAMRSTRSMSSQLLLEPLIMPSIMRMKRLSAWCAWTTTKAESLCRVVMFSAVMHVHRRCTRSPSYAHCATPHLRVTMPSSVRAGATDSHWPLARLA